MELSTLQTAKSSGGNTAWFACLVALIVRQIERLVSGSYAHVLA